MSKSTRLLAARARSAVAAAVLVLSPAVGAAAEPDALAALLGSIDERVQAELATYRAARAAYETEAQAFWAQVAEKRTERRRKRAAAQAVTGADFVSALPPVYAGPQPSREVQAILAEEEKRSPPTPVLTVADALAAAQTIYRFVPERIPEPEFKRRYAIEALSLGLTKDQVIRVYALETGGIGTADMQSGINPITGQGRAISTALGYAQLLHANSVNEIVLHGDGFAARLEKGARAPGLEPARRDVLVHKAAVVRAMLAQARSVPNEWSAHVRFAATPAGIGIHALNLDGDIGPWLQVVKLKGLKLMAETAGRPSLSGAEMELMNLAGPGTALEMMGSPDALAASTVNFFSRGGYERNPIVRGRTSAELLAELDRRMNANLVKPGTVEFSRIFDVVLQEQR